MKRINGFLNIDSYFIKNYKKKYVNEFVKKVSDIHYIITINGRNYYFKKLKNPYTELLAYEVAAFLGLKSVSYDLAIFQNMYGVISEDFKDKNCKYVSGQDILFEYSRSTKCMTYLENMGLEQTEVNDYPNNAPYSYNINNLEIIWQAIEYKYKQLGINIDMEKIMNDLILIFIFNVLVMQNDGMSQNWVLEESTYGVNVGLLYDNAEAFKFGEGKHSPQCNFSTNFNDVGLGTYAILEEFLKISDKVYVDLFKEKFNMLTEDVFLKLIQRVEYKIECSIPNEIKTYYLEMFRVNRENIKQVLSKFDKSRI
ncbi:MAG: hypothetical protein IJY87_05860 [Bacilli bacterium]|nr:hypothetical protein [Bacilli bacterium]